MVGVDSNAAVIRSLRAGVVFVLASIKSAQAQPHGHLTIGLGSFPVEMNSVIGGSGLRSYVLAAARRSMTRYDADGRVMCQLCAESPSADGTKGMNATFTLRPGLRSGDGAPLTTKDILLSAELERVFDPRTNLVGVTALDDPPVHDEVQVAAAKDPLDHGARSCWQATRTVPVSFHGTSSRPRHTAREQRLHDEELRAAHSMVDPTERKAMLNDV